MFSGIKLCLAREQDEALAEEAREELRLMGELAEAVRCVMPLNSASNDVLQRWDLSPEEWARIRAAVTALDKLEVK